MQRLWRRAAATAAALLISLVPMSTSSGATETAITADVSVVDGHGHAFPPGSAGVLACPAIGWTVPCSALIVGVDDDGDGHVHLAVEPDVAFRVNGFVRDSGWRDPDYVAPDGTEFHFSELADTTGAQLDGSTFVIERPTGAKDRPEPGTTDVAVRVLDGDGSPFPAGTAGVMACVTPSCEPMIFGSADAEGVATLTLASKVEYTVTALVSGTGWACGGWVSPTGIVFYFSEPLVRTGVGFRRPTTLTIIAPVCP